MMTAVTLLILGFFLGMRHATDADHVVAVTTILSRQKKVRDAAKIGVFWGIGHSLTLFVVGGAIVLLKVVIPERLGLSLELCVSIMLVLLGFFNLRGTSQVRKLDHRRPLLVGVVHGLAGSAAIALLVLPVIHNPLLAMAYLFLFGVGTIAGMLLITVSMAVPIRYATARSLLFQRFFTNAVGFCSIGFGAFLFWHIGFVQGLFLSS